MAALFSTRLLPLLTNISLRIGLFTPSAASDSLSYGPLSTFLHLLSRHSTEKNRSASEKGDQT